MLDPLISIIIPAYQAEKTIARAVESVMKIHSSNIEVVVVNDGSTDGTEDALQELSSKHSNLKAISQENKGRSAARNLGVAHALGKWLMFVDADDYLLPEASPHLVERGKVSDAPLVIFGRKRSDLSETENHVEQNDSFFLASNNYVNALICNASASTCVDQGWMYEHGASWSCLYDREEVLKLISETKGLFGPFPEGIRFSEDRLFNIAYLKMLKSTPVEFVPDQLYYWDVSESQTFMTVHEDDAESMDKFIDVVSQMIGAEILTQSEADAIIVRETLWRFQGMTKHFSDVSKALKRNYLGIFDSQIVKDSIKRTHTQQITNGKFWIFALKLIGNGCSNLALKLTVTALNIKNIVKRA